MQSQGCSQTVCPVVVDNFDIRSIAEQYTTHSKASPILEFNLCKQYYHTTLTGSNNRSLLPHRRYFVKDTHLMSKRRWHRWMLRCTAAAEARVRTCLRRHLRSHETLLQPRVNSSRISRAMNVSVKWTDGLHNLHGKSMLLRCCMHHFLIIIGHQLATDEVRHCAVDKMLFVLLG